MSNIIMPLNMRRIMDDFIALLELKRYSQNTILRYRHHLNDYLKYCSTKNKLTLEKGDVEIYLELCKTQKRFSYSALKQVVSALKFLNEKLLGNERVFYTIPEAQILKDQSLTTNSEKEVITREEFVKIYKTIYNIKHQAIIALIYSAGLRISEVIKLKITDIDSKRMIIAIRAAKGRKDRTVLLSQKILIILREYYKFCKPKIWLFEGTKGKQYSSTSICKIFMKAQSDSGIGVKYTVHSLRHAYATHLLEKGVSVSQIKKSLGHESLKTTEIYTHVTEERISNLANSLDLLDFES